MELREGQKRNLIYGFLLCVIVDLCSKNLWRIAMSPDMGEYIYAVNTSLSFLCLLSFIFYLSWVIGYAPLKIVTVNYLPWSVQDLVDEISGNAMNLSWIEYAGFAATIIFTIYELRHINLIKKTLLLIKSFLTVIFLTLKKFILKSRP